MNEHLIGIQISNYRKAAGMTQEELGEAVGISGQAVSRWECGGAPDISLLPAIADRLGVTIDALFGRDGTERMDMEHVTGSWLCSFPKKERLNRLCRLIWASVRHLLDDGLGIPEMGYLETCRPDMGDGLDWLMLSQIKTAEGILLDIHAEDLSFVTLWPEPEDGYAAWLAPKEEYRCLFELLSRQGCLELLEYLHCRKRGYFIAEAAAKQLGMPGKAVEELLTALEERQVLRSMEFQMLHVALIGVLSVRGIILQEALTGGGNLCGSLSSGLGNMAQDVLSISSAKPYFEKISAHTESSVHADFSVPAGNAAKQDGKAKAEIPMETMQNGIALNHVGFCYDKKTVLKEFSAYFEKGGKYALTGPSGCGKSTLLKLILGCLPEYTGSIRLDNRELRDYRPEQLWHQISYIGQDVFLFHATILDNITLGGTFSKEQIQKALQDSALEDDLQSLPDGLDTIVGENGGNLSGGQKQRVAIARALIHNRSVLLVDEGTSALDEGNADRIERNLLSKTDLTLILVSHHLSAEQKKRFSKVYALSGDS